MTTTIVRFEDLIAWQKARALTRTIYVATRQGAFARDYGLAGQIRCAAVSIMSNIAEGFERRSRPEFAQFLTIAKASCAEVRSQLYVALDVGYIDDIVFGTLLGHAEAVACILSGLRGQVERQRDEEQGNRLQPRGRNSAGRA